MAEIPKELSQLPVNLVGRFFYFCLPFRKKVIKQNIDLVFQHNLAPREKKYLTLAFYSHLATFIKEVVLMFFKSHEQLIQRIDIQGTEHLLQAAEKEKGILLLSCHLGSWEFSSVIGLSTMKDFKGRFHFIRKGIKNKFLQTILFQRYRRAGLHVISKKGALRRARGALAANDAVLFVMDQHAAIHNKQGIAVEFFGKKAGTYRSLAALAQRTGAPVVPLVCYRLASGQHVIEFYPQVEWKPSATTEEAIYHNTRIYNQVLEKLILAHPEQWLWSHRRWKLSGDDW